MRQDHQHHAHLATQASWMLQSWPPLATTDPQLRCPRYVCSFRRRASHNATPIRLALRLGMPSQRIVLTRVASTANCAPPKRGKPSTTTSSLRVSTTPGWIKSRSLIITFVVTCQDSCPRARCSVVATRVKWTATPAGRRSQGERKTKSVKEDHPEQLGWDFRESARRACGQCQPSSIPSLRPDHGRPGCVNSCKDVTIPKVRFDTRGCHAASHPCNGARNLQVHGMVV